METTYRPVKSDARYTIRREFCGYADARFVLRFCGVFVMSSPSYSAALVRAVGESAKRRGALVVSEQV